MSKQRSYLLISLTGFILLTAAVALDATQGIDEEILIILSDDSLSWLSSFTFFGSTRVIVTISLFTILILLIYKKLKSAFLLSLSLGIALIAYQLIKEIIARPRPDIILASNRTMPFLSVHSYPSGHTVGTLTFFLGLCILGLNMEWSTKNIIPFLVIPCMVGLGMIVTSNHYLTDVIGAVLLSFTVVLLVMEMDKFYNIDGFLDRVLARVKRDVRKKS